MERTATGDGPAPASADGDRDQQDQQDNRERLHGVTEELHALLDRLEGKSGPPLDAPERAAAEARVWELADEVTRIALLRQHLEDRSTQ